MAGCPNIGQKSDGETTPIVLNDGSYNSTTGEGKIGEITFKMINIPAVTDAQLGVAIGQDDNKLHKASLSSYYIGQTEVTQELYHAVLTGDSAVNVSPSSFKNTPAAGEIQEKRPVETISWFDAVYFCNVLTKIVLNEADCVYPITGVTRDSGTKKITAATITADFSKKGFRLPSEAEWGMPQWGYNK